MLYSSILIKLAVFLQISTKVLRKIQPDYGNFHRSGHFSCLGDDGDDDADHSIFPKRWKSSTAALSIFSSGWWWWQRPWQLWWILVNITAFYLGQQVQEPHCQYSPLWMMTKTMIMNTMNMTNITAFYQRWTSSRTALSIFSPSSLPESVCSPSGRWWWQRGCFCF